MTPKIVGKSSSLGANVDDTFVVVVVAVVVVVVVVLDDVEECGVDVEGEALVVISVVVLVVVVTLIGRWDVLGTEVVGFVLGKLGLAHGWVTDDLEPDSGAELTPKTPMRITRRIATTTEPEITNIFFVICIPGSL